MEETTVVGNRPLRKQGEKTLSTFAMGDKKGGFRRKGQGGQWSNTIEGWSMRVVLQKIKRGEKENEAEQILNGL